MSSGLWITLGIVGYVLGGLIASRICLFKLQDSTGKMRIASDYGATRYHPLGWPLLAGLLWPPIAVCFGVAAVLLGSYRVAKPALSWWYTQPAVRKASRQKSVVSL
jgi:hypothetical protein